MRISDTDLKKFLFVLIGVIALIALGNKFLDAVIALKALMAQGTFIGAN